jgi:hypothetical protein
MSSAGLPVITLPSNLNNDWQETGGDPMKTISGARTIVVRTALLGFMALTAIGGLGVREVSTAKIVAINCSQLYSAAMYAGGQYQAAVRRSDTATADFWWSIYNRAELT